MRRHRFLVCVFLLCALLCGLCACGSGEAAAAPSAPPEREDLGYLSLTNDDERAFYRRLDEYLFRDAFQRIPVAKGLERDRLSEILDIYLREHPEVFWVWEGDYPALVEGEEENELSFRFALEGEALRQAREAQDAALAAFTAAAPKDADDYERELFAHDWLLDACEYDHAAAESGQYVVAFERTAYGALVEGKAICDGYARAMKLLCDTLGVPCATVTTYDKYALEQGGAALHICDAVRLGGSWYYVDPTNDDRAYDKPADVHRYYYFNMTTEQMEKTHGVMPLCGHRDEIPEGLSREAALNFFLPVCDSEEYNWFCKECPQISGDHAAEVLTDCLTEAAAAGENCAVVRAVEDVDLRALVDSLCDGEGAEIVSAVNERSGAAPITDWEVFGNNQVRILYFLLTYA